MSNDSLYQQRLARYVTAMRNETPDRVPNVLLSFGGPDEVRAFCRRVIDEVAPGGGYIMDAGAIMQNDTSVENLRVLTETTREFGVYPGAPAPTSTPPCDVPDSVADRSALRGLNGRPEPRVAAGVCVPWEEKAKELPPITGNPDLVRGAHIIGHSASELIHTGQEFLDANADATHVAETLYNYPTFSDMYRHAALVALSAHEPREPGERTEGEPA